MLTRMVEKGAIDQFKLAMTKGSTGSLIDMARRKGVDIGSMVLDAFKIAQQAAQYFQTGDFKMAVDKMDMLYSNYEVGANSFAEGIEPDVRRHDECNQLCRWRQNQTQGREFACTYVVRPVLPHRKVSPTAQ